MSMPSPPASFIHIHAPFIHLYTYRCLHPFIHIQSLTSIYTRTWPSVSIYIHNFPLHPFIHVHAPRIIMYIPLHSFIHVQHPFIHAPASVYTCTCHWTHLYTYMPLHLFIHICATVPIYTHTWHCIHLYTYMPLHPSIHICVTVPVYTRPCPWALIPSTCSLILQVSSLFLPLGCFYWNVIILWSRPPACAFP